MQHINALTSAVDMSLMMDLYNGDYNISTAHYDDFKVADASNDYSLTIGGHSGNIGEATNSREKGYER